MFCTFINYNVYWLTEPVPPGKPNKKRKDIDIHGPH